MTVADLFSAGTGGGKLLEILRPVLLLVLAQLVEVVPGKDAGAVPVGELRLHRVRADRLERADLDRALADLQHFLPRTVPSHFGRRRIHAQVLERQPEAAAVGERDLQHVRFLVQRDAGGNALGHRRTRSIPPAFALATNSGSQFSPSRRRAISTTM